MGLLEFHFKYCQEMTNVLSNCKESLGKENVLSKYAFSSERALNTPNTFEQHQEISLLQATKGLSIYNI